MRKRNNFLILALLGILIGGVTMNALSAQKPIRVKLGNEVFIEKHLDWVKGKRVGLITNPTGINSNLESVIDVFQSHPDIQLVALYGPEHGVRGDVPAGQRIETFTDEQTGLKVHSLYGRTRTPTEEMLKDIDVLVFDIQDIGSRSYTYISTMATSMIAAASYEKTYIVLDRPNPLGGNLLEGNILDPKFASFIGFYPIPYIHGLTIGELALLFNEHLGIGCDLKVAQMEGWQRSMTFPETGLPWVNTSTHIPEPDTALFYNITGIFGELNGVNIGVGFTAPFKLVGAPWINASELCSELNGRKLPGVRFSPSYFKPYYYHFQGQTCQGVRIHLADPQKVRPCRVGFHIMTAMRDLYPAHFNFEVPENKRRIGMFDKACGTDQVRKDFVAGLSADEIANRWEAGLSAFLPIREKYLLY